MNMRKLDTMGTVLVLGTSAIAFAACIRDPVMSDGSTTMDMTTTGEPTTTITPPPSVDDTTTTAEPPNTSDVTTAEPPDTDTTGEVLDCTVDGSCPLIDVVFVVDNSGSMGTLQLNLARSFGTLVEELQELRGDNGQPLRPDVNIMVTTTDMGHPLCTAFQPPDYTPQNGAPVYSGCNARINRFTGISPTNPLVIEEACTENCPADIVPGNHFIHFDADSSNVPNDDVTAALACIGPQGIDGCGYESPLEAMLQAANEGACWNNPEQNGCDSDPEWSGVTEGFLRDGATLAVVFFTDELDCSVQGPNGYSFFTDIENAIYWNINPDLGAPQATSAVCRNAGVACSGNTGIYEACVATDNEALHPVARYTQYLDYLSQTREVVMLSLTGVPPVVAHNPEPPYEPVAGGAVDLLYREWIDAPYPAGDILPAEWNQGQRAANKIFEFGDIAPGCFGQDDLGDTITQGLPPVRIREVCEHLDSVDDKGNTQVHCCIESVCEGDFSNAFRCLGGTLSEAIERSN